MILCVLVSVVTVLAAVGLPAQILREAREVFVCVADPENCDRSAEAEDLEGRSDSELLPCTPSSRDEVTTSSTSFLFTKSSSGTRYSVSQRPDGTVEILETTSRGRGGQIAAGGGIGKKGGKLGIEGAATNMRVEEEGDIYVLETEEERARFERARSQPAVDAYIDPFGEWKNPDDYERKYEYLMSEFREGSYERVSDNASVDVSGGARIVKGHLGIEGETGTVVERFDDSGETRVTFDVKASSIGDLGALVFGASSSSEDLASVSLTTTADGTPTNLVLTTERAVGRGVGLELDPTQVVDLPSFIQAAAGWQASERGENVVRITTGIPLRDEAARTAALAFVQNPGADMSADLLERFDASGQGLIELLRNETSTDGFGARVSLLASLGFDDEHSVSALSVKDAWGWEPRAGLRRRTECLP